MIEGIKKVNIEKIQESALIREEVEVQIENHPVHIIVVKEIVYPASIQLIVEILILVKVHPLVEIVEDQEVGLEVDPGEDQDLKIHIYLSMQIA